ncbi:hypothetical protein [Nonlabens sp. SY33080]|uniref:hypothetical protein n=1 Tax=Nonlabens sp. SY33080 TaxID=2719911 RepID=UPI001428D5ED|nr:hypothetical protein [Nonlabens sp. SY33080]
MRIFIKSLNLLDLALDKTKNKSKQKDFAMCVAESKRQFATVLFIAKPLLDDTYGRSGHFAIAQFSPELTVQQHAQHTL